MTCLHLSVCTSLALAIGHAVLVLAETTHLERAACIMLSVVVPHACKHMR